MKNKRAGGKQRSKTACKRCASRQRLSLRTWVQVATIVALSAEVADRVLALL